jgi:hypothetical protein
MKFFKKLRRFVQQITVSESKPVLTLKQLSFVRERHGIQIEPVQLLEIIQTIKPPVNFLVFGLGNDSGLWLKRNIGGRTVFIEDDPAWFDNIKQKNPILEAYLVNYGTKRTDWEMLLEEPLKLQIDLPPAISKTKWDVILVDAPPGYADDQPGRMKSIFLASQLIKAGGDVFLHDCNRQIEQKYADRFFNGHDLLSETGSEVLRHYRISIIDPKCKPPGWPL